MEDDMSGKVLVTDSLFIFDEHIKQLNDAGFEVERLDKPSASEEELEAALKGKVGYILGGIEKATDSLLSKVDGLKAIGVTATAWDGFVTGKDIAKEKGIMVANTPHANAQAVAEWAFSSSLAMVRNLFSLGRTGTATFKTSPGFSELNIGIVGLGSIWSCASKII
jgi:phosphoglycerate dehydrogenase-like enzyme